MEIVVNNLISIFTVIEGNIYLLMDKNELINIKCDNEIDIVNEKYIKDNLNINNLNLKQCYTFSKKENDKLIISILFMDIVNYDDIKLNSKFNLKRIDDLEKNICIDKLIECLRKEMVLNSTIKKIYPSTFSLPEIQKLYEELLNKKYDRRNFRKRLIKLDVIECLDGFDTHKSGRPAKLYRFKDITEDKLLF